MAELSVHNIFKTYDPAFGEVVKDVSLCVESGEFYTLLGASGCGKTTLLRMIAGFEKPDAGEIELSGRKLFDAKTNMKSQDRKVGFVFQDYALFPHMSVIENVSFGLKGMNKADQRKRAMRVLDMLDMETFAQRMPDEISGGQQQRVALARSMAVSPSLILLDEPFSNLDAGQRENTRWQVRNLLKEEGITAMLVTHDQQEALSIADRVAVMKDGEILQEGEPETLYMNPTHIYVADFLGGTNLFEGDAKGTWMDAQLGLQGKVELNENAIGRVTASLRPEDIMLKPAEHQAHAQGQIVTRQFFGHDQRFGVQVGQQIIHVQADAHCQYRVGDYVNMIALRPAVVMKRG